MTIVYYLIGGYFLIYAFYWLVLAFFGRKKTASTTSLKLEVKPKLAVCFPAYKPDSQLIKALEAIEQAYKPMEVLVYVLLQEANEEIIHELKRFPFCIERKNFLPQQGQNIYHQVLKYICATLDQENPTHLLLLDKDNVVQQDYFVQLQQLWDMSGDVDVWQGIRKPLQIEGPTQAYDALSESLNNQLLRQAKNNLGMPAELSGSAGVFKWGVFKNAVYKLDGRAPGMDKNLMIQMLLDNPNTQISYAPNLVVLEEKTAKAEVLQQQRTRWFGNQYFNALYYTLPLIKTGSMACIDYALTLCRPPRLWQLALMPILGLGEIGGSAFSIFPTYLFTFSTILMTLGIVFFLWKNTERIKWCKMLFAHIPRLLYSSIWSVLKGMHPKNQGKFIHTERY